MWSNFGGEVTKPSMTYLKANGNASGSVNLPMPIRAAPTTKRRYGLTNPTNLKITDLEIFTSSGFIENPQQITQMQVCASRVGNATVMGKQRACLSQNPRLLLILWPAGLFSPPSGEFLELPNRHAY